MSQVSSVGQGNIVAYPVQPQPGLPPAGVVYVYADQATGKLSAIDSTGATVIAYGGPAFSPVTHQFLTGVSASGVFSAAQPSAADLSNGVQGTGAVVLASSPTLTTPNVGAATASSVTMSGSSSGSTLLQASATASGTLTLPAASDTLIAKATTDVLTNKTLSTSGSGNHIQIGSQDIPTAIGSAGTCLSTENGTSLSFGGKWTFLGRAVWSSGATVGPVTWTNNAYKYIYFRLKVAGYASGGIASLQLGGASIDTGANYAAGILEGATLTSTSINVTGVRVGATAITSQRYVEGTVSLYAAGSTKMVNMWGSSNSTSAGTAPTVSNVAGIWADTSNTIGALQFTAFNAVTGTTTVNFTSGTEVEAWGRNDT